MRSPGFWRLWGYINATALIYLAAFCRCACERSPKCSSYINKAVVRRKYYTGRARQINTPPVAHMLRDLDVKNIPEIGASDP